MSIFKSLTYTFSSKFNIFPFSLCFMIYEKMSLIYCVGILLLPWFSCARGKCIFDQIQRSVNIVSPPTGQYASAHWFKTQRSKRHIASMGDFQPIRIKTWIPPGSPALSDWERERLMSAVSEAVSDVSSLLSGVWSFYMKY